MTDKEHLKPRLDLLLHVLDGPVRKRFLAEHLLRLLACEALGLGGRVVTQTVGLANFLIRHRGGSLAVGALVHGDDDGTTETQIVLQAVLGVLG